MKLSSKFLIVAALTGCFCSFAHAQQNADRVPTGVKKTISEITDIEIRNLQGEKLGRIRDLGVDLSTGRVIEVLVVTGEILGLGGKTVSVPPLALNPDAKNEIYTLSSSVEFFKAAPEVDLDKWETTNQGTRIAAAYRYFGQDPFFLESGVKSTMVDGSDKITLGYVERSSKINGLEVKNLQNELLGKVYSLGMDIPKGRITQVILVAPILATPNSVGSPDEVAKVEAKVAGDASKESRCVVPAMALSFNAARDGLLIDNTKEQFAEQPRYALVESSFGRKAQSSEESYEGPHTGAALEQGSSDLDVACTTLIKKNINDAKIGGRRLQVGTKDGRVTLRGMVRNEADKAKVAAIAVSASRLELVDNQLTVAPVRN